MPGLVTSDLQGRPTQQVLEQFADRLPLHRNLKKAHEGLAELCVDEDPVGHLIDYARSAVFTDIYLVFLSTMFRSQPTAAVPPSVSAVSQQSATRIGGRSDSALLLAGTQTAGHVTRLSTCEQWDYRIFIVQCEPPTKDIVRK